MKSMKTWKKPIIQVMSAEEVNSYIKAAAWSFCWSVNCR